MLLDLQLLELDELGASGLEVEPAARAVGLTLFTGAHYQGHEGRRLDL